MSYLDWFLSVVGVGHVVVLDLGLLVRVKREAWVVVGLLVEV